jgi:hypothetical protein
MLERRSVRPLATGQGVMLYAREWRVSVFDRGDPARGPVVCVAATLGQALEGAVGMAKEAGWGSFPGN